LTAAHASLLTEILDLMHGHRRRGPIWAASCPERADSASMMTVSGTSARPEASGE
jgi:hypothetical protein